MTTDELIAERNKLGNERQELMQTVQNIHDSLERIGSALIQGAQGERIKVSKKERTIIVAHREILYLSPSELAELSGKLHQCDRRLIQVDSEITRRVT